MSPATITQVEESAVDSNALGAALDVQVMDAAQRRTTHPFSLYCDAVREAEGLPASQQAKQVVSEVCNAVAKLTIVDDEQIDEQAEHIAKLVSKDREDMGDKQLWLGPATRIAKRALTLRSEGKAVIADSAKIDAD
jgi:hypothetical protein